MKNEGFLNLVKLKTGRSLQDPMVLQRFFFQSLGGTRAVVESNPSFSL